MKTGKPTVGESLTLAMAYWHGDGKKGTKVTVLSSRKNTQCKTGLEITVSIPNVKHPAKLDAGWFSEYAETFKYVG